MSTLGTTYLTLADKMKREDPDHKIARIIELLAKKNEILLDMQVVEGNLPTGHMTTVRTGIPSGTWRRMYQGVQPEKSTTRQVTDTCGMLETYSQVDKALADLNGNTAAFRASEASAFMDGLNQTMAQTLFYGDTDAYPERFMGLDPRFSDTSAENGEQILLGGGSTASSQTSIWLIVWGPNTVHGIYPKGSTAGIQHEDKGQVTVTESDGSMWEAYRDHWRWDLGLTVRDWRYVVRIANIEPAALTKDASAGADLMDLMVQALEQVEDLEAGTPVFYCNRTIKSWLRRQMLNANSNVMLSMGELAGKPVMMFGEVPVRRCDAIVNTEAVVS